MELNNKENIRTRISGTKFYCFSFPKIGDKVILIHNPFNRADKYAIKVINSQLEQIGHLPTFGGFNKRVGDMLKWQPHTAKVTQVFQEFSEIFIEIDNVRLS